MNSLRFNHWISERHFPKIAFFWGGYAFVEEIERMKKILTIGSLLLATISLPVFAADKDRKVTSTVPESVENFCSELGRLTLGLSQKTNKSPDVQQLSVENQVVVGKMLLRIQSVTEASCNAIAQKDIRDIR